MTYEILFSDLARRQLLKLEGNDQERIITALERIRIRPERYVKKLIGYPGYRMRVGDFRIIMDIEHDILHILVIKIGHRRNIYQG